MSNQADSPTHAAAQPDGGSPWLAQYGAHIPATLPAPADRHLGAWIGRTVERFGRNTAFTTVMPNGMYGSLTYEQVGRLSDDFALYLREELGLQRGDRVALQMPNCLAYPVAALGTLKAGCVVVNTNPLYTPAEMAHQFRDSGAKAIVIVDVFAGKLQEILHETAIRHVVIARVSEFFPPVVGAIVHAVMKYWNRAIPEHRLQARRLTQALAQGHAHASRLHTTPAKHVQAYGHEIQADDLALLQYTGGTTGIAKGAMLTHANLLWNVAQIRAMCGTHIDEGKEVMLTALPVYHIFAFTVNFLTMFAAGARNILVPNPRPVQFLQRAIENYRITWITGVNTLYNALLNEEWFTAFPPRHLKVAGGGGAAMHHAVVERWENTVRAPLIEGYGLTEASPVVCFQPLHGLRQPDTIGIPVPMTDVRLVDDAGQPVAQGAPGELCVRGPQVMRGYWQRAQETQEVLREGWLHTGDIATMAADGTLRIVDRKKDMILVSGFNVYPNEVEDAIARHDKVLEVAVIGVPDDKTGEAVQAHVVRRDPSLTQAEVLAHCRTLLTGYKQPTSVVFVDDLPKTAVGKILRKDVRRAAAAPPPC